MTSAAPIRDAATVVLLRPADGLGQSYRIYFVKRHAKSGFFANAHVFPGGKLDASDCAAAVDLNPAQACARLREDCEGSLAVGLHVAAVRETFEEAGVLLAVGAGGDASGGAGFIGRLDAWRARLSAGDATFSQLIAAESLVVGAAALLPWSRWITPEIEPRRFDTRFFVAALPDGQEPLHDERETTAGEWLSPDEAIAAYQERRIQLAPPTLRTLEELSELPTVEAVLAQRRALHPIRPAFVNDSGAFVLALPGDPLYPGRDHTASQGIDRFTLSDGLWVSRRR